MCDLESERRVLLRGYGACKNVNQLNDARFFKDEENSEKAWKKYWQSI